MAIQPLLRQTLPSIGEIKMDARRTEILFDRDTCLVDGAHIHSCYEIYVNLSGDVSFLHNQEIYPIDPGDVILSHPAEVHHCIYHANCTHDHFCIWFAGDALGDFLKRRGIRGRIRPSAEGRERMMPLLQRICGKDADPFLKASYLLELLVLLDGEYTTATPEKAPDKMRAILSYIDAHLLEISSISEVSQAFFLSASTLNRMFRKHLGFSFGKYLETQKLSLAEQLLRADHSVTDACFRSGFTDCSRFITKFKDKFGTTPLKYKKKL